MVKIASGTNLTFVYDFLYCTLNYTQLRVDNNNFFLLFRVEVILAVVQATLIREGGIQVTTSGSTRNTTTRGGLRNDERG